MNLLASETISFQEAIALTESFLEQRENLNEKEKEKTISSLVKTENGARGFFVTYLTNDGQIADFNSEGIIKGLKSSPEIVGELLVKNVAMSTAMVITHQRNNNQEMAQKSEEVKRRSIEVIKKLNLDLIHQKIKQLTTTINQEEGVYQEFLNRWGYDQQQKKAIAEAFSLISPSDKK
jgi:hypothetical protein